MGRQKIILVQEERKKEGSSWGSILSSLTAILTVLTATLYLAGYLFLTGYYAAFNLPISLIGLSSQRVLMVAAVLLIPIGGIFLLVAAFFVPRSTDAGFGGFGQLHRNRWFYFWSCVYALILIFAIPPTGRWFADKQIARGFSGYKPLAEPLPYVSVQCKQSLPGVRGGQDSGNGTVTYKNLRLVATNDKYFFLYSPESGTFLTPLDSVLWMGFASEPLN